jgi:hypothetical protein
MWARLVKLYGTVNGTPSRVLVSENSNISVNEAMNLPGVLRHRGIL